MGHYNFFPDKLPEPGNISPLIRTARWSALLAGVIYGFWRHERLTKECAVVEHRQNELRKAMEDKLKYNQYRNGLLSLNELGEACDAPKKNWEWIPPRWTYNPELYKDTIPAKTMWYKKSHKPVLK